MPAGEQITVSTLQVSSRSLFEPFSDMSKTMKIKRVTKELLEDYVLPTGRQQITQVQGEIDRVLYRDHISYIKKAGMWPKAFGGDQLNGDCQSASHVYSDEDDDSDLFVNTNYPTVTYEGSDFSSDDDDC
ncbi:hypothetical protein HPB50_019434 [Hyalomma asiaticum]|uniref:Uncharacterized protein n=1 Tax=Hyalomma asiaticum TaxID=266040 RepID=A0ACB7RPY2_HYAAI|nr:hypothetical protein HPB50_019434 [Hyalomma asiaticum]